MLGCISEILFKFINILKCIENTFLITRPKAKTPRPTHSSFPHDSPCFPMSPTYFPTWCMSSIRYEDVTVQACISDIHIPCQNTYIASELSPRVCLVGCVISNSLSHLRYLKLYKLAWDFVMCLLADICWKKLQLVLCLVACTSWDWSKTRNNREV
jgi:hypothetical protein